MLGTMIARLDSTQTFILLIVAVVTLAIALLLAVVAVQWRAIHVAQAALKQAMIDRGMSAEEIERVLRASVNEADDDEEAAEAPGPCEVIVERDGEWVPAIILQSGLKGCSVHFVGEEATEKEWVE